MTPLEQIKGWIETYPNFEQMSDFQVDYTDHIPYSGGIFPSGLVEVERRSDIVGNVTVTNQYNFGLYYVFEKDPDDNIGATVNANWVMDFQQWVQEQSIFGLAPVFGDVPTAEKITAQNGVLYETNEGTATYMVRLSVQFKKKYEVKNEWLI